MAGTGDFKVAVKLHADASQYTAEFTKASQLAQTFAGTLQAGGSQAASGLQTATTASQALGAATVSSSQQASSSLTQVSTAAQSLGGHLQTTGTQATQASQGMDGLTKSSREATQSQQQSRAAGDALIAMLRDQIATTGKSSEELLRYRAAQSGVAAEAAPLILQWQNQKAAQLAAAEAARQEEAAQREAQAVKQRAAQTQEQFLAGLREQIALQGKSSTEVLQYRAAQLGVSAEAANSIRLIDDANKKGAISAGQHAQAMRMLPAQMTDVVTSVASGMPIWMVAIQQGGQIKDSFGGAGAAARAMLGAITPLAAGLAVGTAAIGLTAAAYYQGSAEADGFRKALVMTGNTAGVTVSQMSEISKAVGDVVGGQHSASQALTQLAGTGAIAGESLQQFTTVAMNLERYAGQPIKKTAEDLAKLGDEPVKASMQLNEQYHYLTESVYRQIKALEDQGRKDDAAALAQKTYSDAMAERAGTMKSNLGTLERAWESLGSMASKAWNAMLNVGRAATLDDIRTKIDNTNRDLNDLLSGDGFASNGGGAAFGAGARGRAARIEQLKKQLSDLNAQAAPLEAEDAQAQIKAQQRADEEVKLAARQRTDALAKEVRSRADIRKQEIEQLDRDRKTLDLSQKEYDKLLAGINSKYKDPKGNKGTGSISVTDTDLANMRSQLQAAQQYHQQLLTLGSGATELNSAERESLKIAEQLRLATDGKTIARLQEKQAIADTLAAQLRSNEGLEQSYKAHQQAIDANYKDAQSIGQRARDQAAANEVFGKGRTAIEQMTLATLEHQLAEAEGSDRFDPKYIASLREKIAAQKDWVAALGQADYKAVTAHVDQLLRNAQELSKTYEDELALSGLTALEREKIVAKRAVELKYAKELAKLDQQSLKDDEKAAARQKIEQARDIESAAVVSKAQQDHMAKASEEINRSLTDALMRGFESGKGMAENLADTTVNLFNTMVLRPTISAVMTPVSVAINGVVQQGLSSVGLGSGASQAGSNPLGGGLTDWSSWGSKGSAWLWEQGNSLMDAGWGKLGESVMGLGSTVNSVNAYLKGIPGFSGGIGSAAGYLGSIYALSQGQYGTAIGSAIGTAILPGVGTMIGSTLGGLVDSLFGGDDIPRYAASAEYRGGVTSKGWTPGDQWNDALYPMVNGLAGVIGSALDATAKTFGKTAGYELSTTFSKDAENNGIFGTLNITGPDGKNLVDWSKYDKDWGGRWFSDGDAGAKEFMAAITADVKSAFQAMDLPGWSTQLINAAENIDGINAALQQIGTIKAVFDSLGQTMEMFAGISGDLQTRLLHAAGSIDALTNAVGAFYQGFYSEQERMDSLTDQLRQSLSALGSSIDPSIGEHAKVEFRDAVRGAMESGQVELAYQLMAMSSSFTTAADYAAKAAEQAAQTAAEAAKKARDTAKDNAWANVQAAIDREKSYWSGIASASQAAVGSLTSTLDLLTSNARELYGTVDSTQQMLAAQGMVYIEDALAAVRGGASATGLDQLQDAISAARDGISGGVYATQFERERDALVLAGQLSELGELADSQLTAEERQLKAAQTQIDQLDQALGYWRQQIDGTGQLIDVGLSAVDAIAALAAALEAREQAKLQPQKGPVAGGAWDGVGPYQYGGGNSFLDGVIDYGNQYGSDAYYFIPGVNDYAAKQANIENIAGLLGISVDEAWALRAGDSGQNQAYWQAVQNASNAGAVVNASDSLEDILRKAGVPGYEVGANYIPNDQVAFLHKGEAVVPAPFNPWAGGMQRMLGGLGMGNGMGGNTERLEQLVEKVAVEVQRLQAIVGEGNRAQSDLLDITDQKSEGGSADRVRITNVEELAMAIKKVMA